MSKARKYKSVVACYDKKGRLVKIYPNAREAARKRHLFPRSIDKCIRGDNLTIRGLRWKRFLDGEVLDNVPPLEKAKKNTKKKPIAKIDDNGNILEIYSSLTEAAKKNDLDAHTIRDRINHKYRYIGKAKFKYLDNEK